MSEQSYRIKNTATGLYSKGGVDAHRFNSCWAKKGKIWNNLSGLSTHLSQFKEIPIEWEIEVIEYTVVETLNARKYKEGKKAEAAKKEIAKKMKALEDEERRRQEREAILAKLTPEERRKLGI